jgi:hypothetical protein
MTKNKFYNSIKNMLQKILALSFFQIAMSGDLIGAVKPYGDGDSFPTKCSDVKDQYTELGCCKDDTKPFKMPYQKCDAVDHVVSAHQLRTVTPEVLAVHEKRCSSFNAMNITRLFEVAAGEANAINTINYVCNVWPTTDDAKPGAQIGYGDVLLGLGTDLAFVESIYTGDIEKIFGRRMAETGAPTTVAPITSNLELSHQLYLHSGPKQLEKRLAALTSASRDGHETTLDLTWNMKRDMLVGGNGLLYFANTYVDGHGMKNGLVFFMLSKYVDFLTLLKSSHYQSYN